MTGQQLMDKLASLTPEERSKEVVVEGENGWLYAASDVRMALEHHGKEDDKGTPAIVITNNF